MAEKIKDTINNFSDAELSERLIAVTDELVKLRFQHAVEGNLLSQDLNEKKKEIARIKTEQRARVIGQMSEGELNRRSKIRARRRRN